MRPVKSASGTLPIDRRKSSGSCAFIAIPSSRSCACSRPAARSPSIARSRTRSSSECPRRALSSSRRRGCAILPHAAPRPSSRSPAEEPAAVAGLSARALPNLRAPARRNEARRTALERAARRLGGADPVKGFQERQLVLLRRKTLPADPAEPS